MILRIITGEEKGHNFEFCTMEDEATLFWVGMMFGMFIVAMMV